MGLIFGSASLPPSSLKLSAADFGAQLLDIVSQIGAKPCFEKAQECKLIARRGRAETWSTLPSLLKVFL